MSDSIGQDEEVARRVQRLPLPEQLAREFGPQEVCTTASRPVQDEYRIAHNAVVALPRRAERAVMETKLWKHLPRGEREVADDEVSRRGLGIIDSMQSRASSQNHEQECLPHVVLDIIGTAMNLVTLASPSQ